MREGALYIHFHIHVRTSTEIISRKSSMKTASVLKDWDRREDVESIRTSIQEISHFLNKFGERDKRFMLIKYGVLNRVLTSVS